jgi:hypothetical protein
MTHPNEATVCVDMSHSNAFSKARENHAEWGYGVIVVLLLF